MKFSKETVYNIGYSKINRQFHTKKTDVLKETHLIKLLKPHFMHRASVQCNARKGLLHGQYGQQK